MMDLEMTFQLARDLMAADSVEMIQRETIKFIESRLGQPAAIAVRESSGHYRRCCVRGPRCQLRHRTTAELCQRSPTLRVSL